ncbi:hypothetical protein ACP70R_012104 [Stipagrostis hirtigluma subsp. patula]
MRVFFAPEPAAAADPDRTRCRRFDRPTGNGLASDTVYLGSERGTVYCGGGEYQVRTRPAPARCVSSSVVGVEATSGFLCLQRQR